MIHLTADTLGRNEVELLRMVADGLGGAINGDAPLQIEDSSESQSTTSSNATPGTSNATVFTLAAGERGWIQNLDDAALAVKYGASAAADSFTLILKAGAAADDGLGGSILIDDWIGDVSVFALAGTARYIATKLS